MARLISRGGARALRSLAQQSRPARHNISQQVSLRQRPARPRGRCRVVGGRRAARRCVSARGARARGALSMGRGTRRVRLVRGAVGWGGEHEATGRLVRPARFSARRVPQYRARRGIAECCFHQFLRNFLDPSMQRLTLKRGSAPGASVTVGSPQSPVFRSAICDWLSLNVSFLSVCAPGGQ
jgi:hypothetical protein